MRNNYGAVGARDFAADYVIEAKVPRRGSGAPKNKVVKGEQSRSLRILSEENYKLTGTERTGKFETMKKNARSYAVQDAVAEVASAAVVGAVVGAATSSLYAGADWASGKTSDGEAFKQVAAGARVGMAVGGVSKAVETGAQAVARFAASKGALAPAACARNAAPVLGATIGVACAAKAVWDASKDGATWEDTKEAAAQVAEATFGTVATICVVALEFSGPAGWGILGVGIFSGWCIRKLL